MSPEEWQRIREHWPVRADAPGHLPAAVINNLLDEVARLQTERDEAVLHAQQVNGDYDDMLGVASAMKDALISGAHKEIALEAFDAWNKGHNAEAKDILRRLGEEPRR